MKDIEMKKDRNIKGKLFNLAVYTMLAWSVISAGYLALPIELQEQLPQMNWLTAVVSGGATFLLGSGGLAVQSMLLKMKKSNSEKDNLMVDKFLKIVDGYKEMVISNEKLNDSITHNNKLLEVSLKTKLSNPMLDNTARDMIEQVGVNHDKQE
jgi:hypothetical protein